MRFLELEKFLGKKFEIKENIISASDEIQLIEEKNIHIKKLILLRTC